MRNAPYSHSQVNNSSTRQKTQRMTHMLTSVHNAFGTGHVVTSIRWCKGAQPTCNKQQQSLPGTHIKTTQEIEEACLPTKNSRGGTWFLSSPDLSATSCIGSAATVTTGDLHLSWLRRKQSHTPGPLAGSSMSSTSLWSNQPSSAFAVHAWPDTGHADHPWTPQSCS